MNIYIEFVTFESLGETPKRVGDHLNKDRPKPPLPAWEVVINIAFQKRNFVEPWSVGVRLRQVSAYGPFGCILIWGVDGEF